MAAPDDDELDDLLSSLSPEMPASDAAAPAAPAAEPEAPSPADGEMSLEDALAPPPAFGDAEDKQFPRVETDTAPPPIVEFTPAPALEPLPPSRRHSPLSTLADGGADDGGDDSDELPPIRTPLPPGPAAEPAPEPEPTPTPDPAPEFLEPAERDEPALAVPTPSPRIEAPSPNPSPAPSPTLGAHLDATPSPSRGLPAFVWVGLISFAVAGLGTILYTQVDAFHPERQKTRDGIAKTEEERALAEHQRAQPVAGDIAIEANVDEAAVWLLLGRTPLESITLPSNQVHEVRFELEGRKTLDAVIDRSHWSADGPQMATLKATLRRGANKPPAYPAQGAVVPPAGPKGKGRLVLETDPNGARAWLLIGFTPDAKLVGIETKRRYEFKVQKDGHRPGFAVVRAQDWITEGVSASRRVVLPPLRGRRK